MPYIEVLTLFQSGSLEKLNPPTVTPPSWASEDLMIFSVRLKGGVY